MGAFEDFQGAFGGGGGGGGGSAATSTVTPPPGSNAKADFMAAFGSGAPAKLPAPSAGAIAKDVAQQAGSALVEGPVMATVGAPGDIDQMSQPGGAFDQALLGVAHRLYDWTGYGPQKGTPERGKFDKAYLDAEKYIDGFDPLSGKLPTTHGILDAAGIQLPEPETTAGRYTRMAGDFAAGAVTGGAPSIVARGAEAGLAPAAAAAGRAGLSGIAPGVGAQAATDLADATGNADLAPVAQLFGGAAGHAIPHAAAAAGSGLVHSAPVGGALDAVGIAGPAKTRAVRQFDNTSTDPAAVRQALANPANPQGAPGTKFSTISTTDENGTPIFAQPTTGEVTQDPGVMVAQRGDMVRNTAAYLPQMAEGNEARIRFMQSDPGADPLAVSTHLRDSLDAIHDDASTKLDQAKADAQAQYEAAQAAAQGGIDTAQATGDAQVRQADASTQAALDQARARQAEATGPIESVAAEALGERMRQPLADINAEAKAREGALHDAIDPNNTLTVSTAPMADAVRSAYGNLAKAESGDLSPAEQKFVGLIGSYQPVESYKEAAALSSILAKDMRAERAANQGITPAYRRMSMVMSGVKDALHSTVQERQAAEAQAVADGRMSAEDTIDAHVKALQQKWATAVGRTSAFAGGELAGTGTGTGGFAGRATPADPGGTGAAGAFTERSVRSPSDSRVPQEAPPGPVSEDAAQRIRAANAATRERKATFERGAVGDVLRSGPVAGEYKISDARVPAKLFQPGPAGGDAVRSYFGAAGDHPQAVDAMHAAATNELAKIVEKNGGSLTEAGLRYWQRRHEGALRAIDERSPGFSSHFDTAANATAEVERLSGARRDAMREAEDARDAAVKAATRDGAANVREAELAGAEAEKGVDRAGRQAAKDFQQGIVKHLLLSSDPGSVVAHMKTLIADAKTGAREADRIVAAVKGHPEAEAGLRNATARAFSEQIVGTEKILGNDTPMVKANAGKALETAMPVLSRILTPEHLELVRRAVADAERQETLLSGTKLPRGSNTGQDTAAAGGHGGAKALASHGAVSGFMVLAYEHGEHVFNLVPGWAQVAGGMALGSYAVRKTYTMLRNMGIKSTQRYFEEMLRNPEFAAQMVKRVSPTYDVRQQRITGLIRKSLMIRPPDEHDDGPGGARPNDPPPTGPFSREGRPKASSSPAEALSRGPEAPSMGDGAPSSADNRGRVEPTVAPEPRQSETATAPAAASRAPNVPLTGRQARTLRAAGYEPAEIGAMSSQERAAAVRQAEAAGFSPTGRITPADRAAMRGALPHVEFDGRSGDGRFAGRGDLLAHPDVNGRVEPTWHPDAEAVHAAILAHEKRLATRLTPESSVGDIRKTTDAAGGDVLAMVRKSNADWLTDFRSEMDELIGRAKTEPSSPPTAGEPTLEQQLDDLLKTAQPKPPAVPESRYTTYRPGKVTFASEEPAGAHATSDGYQSDIAGETYDHSVSYVRDGDAIHAIIHGVFRDEEPADHDLSRVQMHKLRKTVEDHLQDHVEEQTGEARWNSLTPAEKRAETEAEDQARIEAEIAYNRKIVAAVDQALAAGWQPKPAGESAYHWASSPEVVKQFASPKGMAKVDMALRSRGFGSRAQDTDLAPSARLAGGEGEPQPAVQSDLALTNARTGATAQARSRVSFRDAMYANDVSANSRADGLTRASSLAVGHRLSQLIGDMPVYTVGPAEMRTLAEGRVKLQSGFEPAGFFDPHSGHIAVLADAMRDPAEASRLIIHEGLHGALMHVINGSDSARNVIDHLRQTAAAQHFERGGETGQHYGLTNAHEFISEAFSNPEFQRFLSSLKADDRMVRAFGLQNTGKTMWDVFTAAVRKIMGLAPKDHTYLDAAMKIGGHFLDQAEAAKAPAPARVTPADMPMPSIGAMQGNSTLSAMSRLLGG